MGRGVNRRRERIMAMPPNAGDICLLMEGDKEHGSDAEVNDGLVGEVLRGRNIWMRDLGDQFVLVIM